MSRPKVYHLEQHAGFWRLRREGNRSGTMRHHDAERLRKWGEERGWLVVLPSDYWTYPEHRP